LAESNPISNFLQFRILSSTDSSWEKIGEIEPLSPCEVNGQSAPGPIVLEDTIHLFYQSYGNGSLDAICHARSTDGVHFIPNQTNPIFSPAGSWNCGRAIDADVIEQESQLFL